MAESTAGLNAARRVAFTTNDRPSTTRTTFDLSDEPMKRAKIAAVKRGFTLRDLVAESLRRVVTEESAAKRKRMTEAPVKLPKGHTIPIQSNQELAQMFEQENIAKIHDVYRGR